MQDYLDEDVYLGIEGGEFVDDNYLGVFEEAVAGFEVSFFVAEFVAALFEEGFEFGEELFGIGYGHFLGFIVGSKLEIIH